MKKTMSDSAGFTLLEVLVAIVILSVGLLGMAKTQVATLRTNTQSNTMLAASSLAQSAMEDILAMDGDDPLFQAEQVDYVAWDGGGVQTVPGSGSYLIFYKTDVDYEGLTKVTKIDIKVESVNEIQSASGLKKRQIVMTALKRYY